MVTAVVTKQAIDSNGPLQEGKRSTFEGGLRVPFVVSGPGIKPGSQCDVPVVQWDLLPTLHDLSASSSPLPPGVDGGSLRDVFERGNNGNVRRNAPGLVFHYTCHYHPPVSVIRIGDYKLMRHLNSSELKLFNVATDYTEQQDLARQLPDKVKEMDQILKQYVGYVDGGEVSEVYAAYFDWLDTGLRKKEERFGRELESLQQKNPPDFEKQLAKLKADLQADKHEHATKTAICKAQMSNTAWRESMKQEVLKKLGVDKEGK